MAKIRRMKSNLVSVSEIKPGNLFQVMATDSLYIRTNKGGFDVTNFYHYNTEDFAGGTSKKYIDLGKVIIDV